MDKENLELNTRISDRTIKVAPVKKKDKAEDLPKAYNPTIEGQFSNNDKTSVAEKRSETAILIKYSQILNQQNSILKKLKNKPEINADTSKEVFNAISSDIKAFTETLKDELSLMARESGKKVKKTKNKK
ncbi:MAG: hypothetical protein IPM48_12430 [Saprospiraceae bacterium]|nr:hypothetical protein [Saprospiraceae bacterium]